MDQRPKAINRPNSPKRISMPWAAPPTSPIGSSVRRWMPPSTYLVEVNFNFDLHAFSWKARHRIGHKLFNRMNHFLSIRARFGAL